MRRTLVGALIVSAVAVANAQGQTPSSSSLGPEFCIPGALRTCASNVVFTVGNGAFNGTDWTYDWSMTGNLSITPGADMRAVVLMGYVYAPQSASWGQYWGPILATQGYGNGAYSDIGSPFSAAGTANAPAELEGVGNFFLFQRYHWVEGDDPDSDFRLWNPNREQCNTVTGSTAPCSYGPSNVVPEPVTMVLLGTGLFCVGGVGVIRRRKRNEEV